MATGSRLDSVLRYSPLNDSKKEVRLLMFALAHDSRYPIHATLTTCSLDDQPSFNALSYVWGDPSSKVAILVSGCVLYVTQNLASALTTLAEHGYNRRPLWVDAICINQADRVERESQVTLMGRLYRGAQLVLAWLGAESVHSAATLRILRQLGRDLLRHQNPAGTTVWLAQPIYHDLCAPFGSGADIIAGVSDLLCFREYYNRAWTFQELALASDAVFLCGDETCGMMDIIRVTHIISPWADQFDFSRAPPGVDKRLWELVESLTSTVTSSFDSVFGVWLNGGAMRRWDGVNIMLNSWQRQATDPRDKIYSVLEMADFKVKVDYMVPYQALCSEVARKWIGKTTPESPRGIDIASVLLLANAGRGAGRALLPSWAPDWDGLSKAVRAPYITGIRWDHRNDQPNVEFPAHLQAAGFEDDETKLVVHGVILDDVEATSFGGIHDTLEFLFRADMATVVHRIILGPPGNTLYRTGIPLVLAILRLLGQDMDYMDNAKTRLRLGSPNFNTLAAAFLALVSATYEGILDADYRAPGLQIPEPRYVLDSRRKHDLTWDQVIGACLLRVDRPAFRTAVIRLGTENPLLKEQPSMRNAKAFYTKTGYMGLGHTAIEPGDKVCVCGSTKVPLILRRIGDHYTFVATAHVMGIMMEGAVWPQVEAGELAVERIVIK